jgi:polar amino acid transport system substrate-binding protein
MVIIKLGASQISMAKIIFYCFFIVLFSQLNAQAKDLRIAGTEWCPYNCVDENRPGIISEYVELIVKRIGMEAKIELVPWSRAITDVKNGKYDVLMSCGESDSKGLIKSKKLLDNQMCFFTLQASNWNYKGLESLSLIEVGAIKDYAYGEPLGSYIAKNRPNMWIMSGQEPHKRLYEMLNHSRIDAFIADKILIKYLTGNKYKSAGCLTSSPLYLAFNKEVDPEIINKINSEISKTKETLNKLVLKYAPPQ